MRTAIPREFQLAGKVWTVEEVAPEVLAKYADEDETIFGVCLFYESRILIQHGLSPQEKAHTFLHELMHAMLSTLGWRKLNEDEDRVDALAGVLHQFLKSKKGRI